MVRIVDDRGNEANRHDERTLAGHFALAVTSAERSKLAPTLPTIAASGVPGYESTSTYAIFGPAKMPVAVVTRLNQEIVRVFNSSDVKDKLLASGIDVHGALLLVSVILLPGRNARYLVRCGPTIQFQNELT